MYSIYFYNQMDTCLEEFGDTFVCKGEILYLEKKTKNNYKYLFNINCIQVQNNKYVDVSHRDIKIYLYVKEKFEYGDIVKCNVEFKKPKPNTNVGGFNTKLFLYSNNVMGYGYVKEVLNIEKNQEGLEKYINNIKYKACEIIDKTFEKDVSDILKTMLLNDESTISENIKNKFYDIGVSHILAPSSSHLMYI